MLPNFGKLIYENDLFVFATQVRQVYYTQGPSVNWHAVTETTTRDLFDMYWDFENDDIEKYLKDQLRSHLLDQSMVDEDEDDISWFRDDVLGTIVDTKQATRKES